jgi:hypothetical protein
MGILFNRNDTTNRKKKDLSKNCVKNSQTNKKDKSLKISSKYSKTQLPIHSRQIDYLINSLNDKYIHVNREFNKIYKLHVKVKKKNNFKYHLTKSEPKSKTEKIVRRKQKHKNNFKIEIKHKLKIKHKLNLFNSYNPILNYKQEKDVNKIINKSDLSLLFGSANKKIPILNCLNKEQINNKKIKINQILKHKIKQSTRRIISKIKFKYQLLTNEKETNKKLQKKIVSIKEPLIENKTEEKVEEIKVSLNRAEETINEDIGKYAVKLDKTLLIAIQLNQDFTKALEIANQLNKPFRKPKDIKINLDIIKISKNDSDYMLI